jgi:hypothetical protein
MRFTGGILTIPPFFFADFLRGFVVDSYQKESVRKRSKRSESVKIKQS